MKRKLLIPIVLSVIAGVGLYYWLHDRPIDPPGLDDYCDATRHAVAADPAIERVVYLDQGWTPAESADFYNRTQGSRLLPYPWFLALEQATSDKPFRDAANVIRLGYLPQQANTCNPDGLPVGFVKDPKAHADRTDWLGLTCAACHTTEIHHGTTAIRIDGGPTLGDLSALLTELTASLKATLDDPAKFDRFAARVAKSDREKEHLRQQLDETYRFRRADDAMNRPPHPYGPARFDAFGRILNEVLVHALGVTDPMQKHPPDAPVSYPFLWDTPHHDVVQWNGVARNKVVGSEMLGGLTRNVGEVLGVFGNVTISPPNTATVFTGYDSSARVPDLIHLEKLLHKLQSPKWPDVFPPIDEEKRKAGEVLFNRHCVMCHHHLDRTDPNRAVTATMTPLKIVGTDPLMATNFVTRKAKTGPLEGRRMFFVTGDRFGAEAPADEIVLHTVVGVIAGSPWDQYKGAQLKELRARRPTVPDDALLAYKARPLNGIWATAPYLHNGSVPNLYQLLLPANQRVKEFHVGSRRFDPVNVGFETGAGGFLFRTHEPGNSNAGHEYAAPRLTDAERWQLVEYLKSL